MTCTGMCFSEGGRRNTFWLAKRTMDVRFKMAIMSSSNAPAGKAGANIRMNSLCEIVVEVLANEPIAIDGSWPSSKLLVQTNLV